MALRTVLAALVAAIAMAALSGEGEYSADRVHVCRNAAQLV